MPGPDPSLVRDFPFFKGLSDEDLRAFLQMARTRRIPKKESVFRQGEVANEFFVLLHGHLKVVQTGQDGRQVIVRVVNPGEIYGVAVAIGRDDYPATAIAMEESITLAWPSSAWASMVDRAPILAANALQAIGQRVHAAHTQVREVATEEIERRIAHVLLRLLPNAIEGVAAAEVEFPITRRDIAEMTGTTLYTVSRILAAWEEQGLVAGGRERIIINDPAKLKEIAENASPG